MTKMIKNILWGLGCIGIGTGLWIAGPAQLAIGFLDGLSSGARDARYDMHKPKLINFGDLGNAKKPVIYVYNDTDNADIDIAVHTSEGSTLTVTYPVISDDGFWHISADKDGNIISDSREYNYLYWEGLNKSFDMPLEGFCVKGEDTVSFLEDSLSELGLTDKEQDDFITYWLPKMQSNEYNVISFNPDAYFEYYTHEYSRDVDHEIMVYMIYYASDTYVDLPEQDLRSLTDKTREGLTIVEWGGSELDIAKE